MVALRVTWKESSVLLDWIGIGLRASKRKDKAMNKNNNVVRKPHLALAPNISNYLSKQPNAKLDRLRSAYDPLHYFLFNDLNLIVNSLI